VTDQRDGDEPSEATPRPDEARSADASGDAARGDEPPDDEGGFFETDDETSEEPERKRGFFRRHKALTILCSLLLVILLAVGGWALYLNSLLGNVDRIDAFGSIDPNARPDPAEGEALNILLGGADNGDAGGPSVAEMMEDGEWSAGSFRSDTIMVMHIPENRNNAYLVSIPRDSYVRVYDETGAPQGKEKINYAFSVYGPSGYVSTIEHLTDVRMDHLAIIDWAGFKDVVDALGGVELYVPQTVYDSSQDYTY
jgi:anionic cell wall polymer biosynthesis LytR-Cps2A-Psr (LCP) family protein